MYDEVTNYGSYGYLSDFSTRDTCFPLGNLENKNSNDEQKLYAKNYRNDGTEIRKAPKDLSISKDGIEFIKEYEKFYDKPYDDLCPSGNCKGVKGVFTIGYGHVIQSGENFGTITEVKALELLTKDLTEAENSVKRYAKTELTQNQYDALISFTFNLGGGALISSDMLEYINSNQFDKAANEFIKFNTARQKDGTQITLRGLTRRREEEANIFRGRKKIKYEKKYIRIYFYHKE